MMIPNKFNGYSRDGLRRYNDPVSAGLVASGTGALGGAAVATGAGALGTGLAAGSLMAGGALPGIMGGMGALGGAGTAGSVLGGAAMSPAVASLAPAATAQAMGPTLLQASLPGVQGGLGALAPSVAPGATSGLASALPGAGSQFAQVAPNLAGREQILQAFSRPELGQNLTQLGPNFAGQVTSLTPQTTGADLAAKMQTAQLKGAGAAALPADTAAMSGIQPGQNFLQNAANFFQNPSVQGVKDYAKEHPYAASAAVGLATKGLASAMQQEGVQKPEDDAMIRPYTYSRTQRPEAYAVSPTMDSSERSYFSEQYTPLEPYKATEKAEGGIASAYAVGGPVEQMAALNAVGANTGYPMAALQTPMYANPAMQRPEATNVIAPSADAGVGAYSGEQKFAKGGETETEGGYSYSYDPTTMQFTQMSAPVIKTPIVGQYGNEMGFTTTPVTNPGTKISGGIATPAMGPTQARQATPINIPAYQSPEQQLGLTDFYNMMDQRLAGYGGYAGGGGIKGESHLGDYSDGGRLLKGPGDGVSDSIPASIGGRQPARLADGEFVVPARIVSELGNGSTEAGARKLYAMMDRIQKGRRKTVGKGKVAVNSKAEKHLPA